MQNKILERIDNISLGCTAIEACAYHPHTDADIKMLLLDIAENIRKDSLEIGIYIEKEHGLQEQIS